MIKNKKTKKFIIEILETLAGATIMAFATAFFLLPNKLSSGGFAGVATILYYFFKIPMGQTILMFNTPLFIFAAYKLGKGFLTKSLIGTLTYSFMLDIFDKFTPLTNDRFLACIYGGIVIGIGTAFILKANASTGGSDLISAIVRKYNPNIRMGYVITIIDAIIVGLNIIAFRQIEIGLYSAIAIYLMGKMIDIVFEGVYFTKLIFIISNKSEEIAQGISEKVSKGTTGLYGKGMYYNEAKTILMCAASRGDVSKVKQVARSIDQHSFIIIVNAREVMGLGFK